MIRFYTKIRKSKRTFDYEEELRETKKERGWSAADWVLHPFDLCESRPRAPWEKCSVCRKHDHTGYRCDEKSTRIVCVMCGTEGHDLHGCDKKICLSCGRLQNDFTDDCRNCVSDSTAGCDVCHAVGHKSEYCTESWRRFHNTISTKQVFNRHIAMSEIPAAAPETDISNTPSSSGPNIKTAKTSKRSAINLTMATIGNTVIIIVFECIRNGNGCKCVRAKRETDQKYKVLQSLFVVTYHCLVKIKILLILKIIIKRLKKLIIRTTFKKKKKTSTYNYT